MTVDITPITATDREVVLSRSDYEELLSRQPTTSSEDIPGSFDDKSAFRVIDGEVYEVHFDSYTNAYLKHRGVLVDHESDAE